MMVAHHGKFVGYFRVSTDRQGIDGYGIAAQRKAIEERLNGGGWTLLKEFVEVESGRKRSRPELLKALAYAKKHKAKLIVSRIDRLTRDTRFLLTLLDSGVEPVFCDLPTIPGAMGRMVLTIMASVAEFEAGLIGERTSAALQAAQVSRKEKGLPQIGGMTSGSKRTQEEARARATELWADHLAELAHLSANACAIELNRRKVKTALGGKWRPVQIIRVRNRIAALNSETVAESEASSASV